MQPPSNAQSHHEIQTQAPSAAPVARLLPPSNPAPQPTQKPARQGTARKSVAGAPKVHTNASPPQKRRRKSASVSSDPDASSTDSDEQYSDGISGEAISSSEEEEEEEEESQDGDNEAASNANANATANANAHAHARAQAQNPPASPVRREADTSDGNISIAQAIKLHIDNQPYTSFFRRWLGVSFSIDEMLGAGRIIPLVHSKIGRMRSRSPLYLLIEEEGFVILQKMYKDLPDGQEAMRTFRIYAFDSVKELQYYGVDDKIMLRFILHPDSSNVQYYKTTSKTAGLGIEEEEEIVLFAERSHDNFKQTAWSNCFRTLTKACNQFKIPKSDCPISQVTQMEDRQKVWQKKVKD